MAGHNKWSKVKHQKAVTDARKAKVFSKMATLIAAESKRAGGDRDDPGLKNAIERAKKESMPKDNIERAVQKGISGDVGDMQAVRFEAYGPAGVAIIIEGLTDNNNRTSNEIKSILSEFGFSLAEMGAASWAFEKTGGEWRAHTTIPISDDDREKLDRLAEALEENEDVQAVYTNAAPSA